MINRLVKYLFLGKKSSSERYIKYLRKKGMVIGEGCTIFSPHSVYIDETRPWMISIGNNVQITRGTTILTHGYDWSVLKGVYGEVLGSCGKVSIGDNVFIGMQSTILKGCHVGNNVIIGANSLINRDIPDNCVAAGNPCKLIMSLEEYHEKRKTMQVKEARELITLYRERYGKEPDEDVLREFFWLFSNDPYDLPNSWKNVNKLCGNITMTENTMKKHNTMYKDMKSFLDSI